MVKNSQKPLDDHTLCDIIYVLGHIPYIGDLMNRISTQNNVQIMQEFANGKCVESRPLCDGQKCLWSDNEDPTWNFELVEYRITPKKPIQSGDLLREIVRDLKEYDFTRLAEVHRDITKSTIVWDQDNGFTES